MLHKVVCDQVKLAIAFVISKSNLVFYKSDLYFTKFDTEESYKYVMQ